MTSLPIRISYVVGAILVVLLQLAVAPNIAVATATPNFVLAYVVATSVSNARAVGYVGPFLLGLVYDFAGSGPVGAMTFVCLASAFFASLLFRLLDNETLFIPIAVMVGVCIAANVAYGLLVIACGVSVGLLEGLLGVALPCSLYDIVLSLIAYPLVLRFVYPDKRTNEMTIIDSKID